MEFKDRLKDLRSSKNLTQQELAKAIFVSRSAIAKWENGLGFPSDANIKTLCEFFKVDENWLFDRQDLKAEIKVVNKAAKKQKSVFLIILIALAVAFVLNVAFDLALCMGLVVYEGSTSSKFIRTYHDIEIYTQKKYNDKDEFSAAIYHTGVGANYFLPKYEEIEYNYSDIDFYIFDGTATLTSTAVTFVLDLKFDDKTEYESAKQNELSTHSFRTEYEEKKLNENPIFEFDVGNFCCKTVHGDGYPRRFGMICLNDKEYVLRYLLFEEWESPEYAKNKEYIVKCTNCPW